MEKLKGGVALLAAGAFLFVAQAYAADIGVIGKKYIVIDKGPGAQKSVFVSKDPGANKNGNDIENISVVLKGQYDGAMSTASQEFDVPNGAAKGWVADKDTVAKFVNKLAPAGPTTAKVAVIKPAKLLKLVAKSTGDAATLDMIGVGAPSGSVYTAYSVTSGGITDNFCSEWTGCAFKEVAAGAGRKLVCKTSSGDPTCVANGPPPTTTTTVPPTTTTTLPALSHFWGYPAPAGGTVDPPPVTVEDQFIGPVLVDLDLAFGLLVPVDKNGEGIPNPVDHLTVYPLVMPVPNPATGVEYSNQFETFSMALDVPNEYLLVPTEKNPGPTSIVPQVDHFLCYQTDTTNPVLLNIPPVSLTDQFQTATTTVLLAVLFCNPADKNNEGILNPTEHLVLYAVDPTGTLAPGAVPIRNQFGDDLLTLDQPQWLLVPSTKIGWCGNGVLEGNEVCETTAPCSAPATCNATCTVCVLAGWTCDPSHYGTNDGCDCGCGIVDPDCADATVASCGACNDPGSCSVDVCPGTINAMDNSTCDVPGSWTCAPTYWNAGDGCDCGCGAFDPDCPDLTVWSCDWCDDMGSCSASGCPGTIAPANNPVCAGCTHGECVAGPPLTPDCTACTSTVCAADSYCCDSFWDDLCVNEATTLCGSCM